MKKRLIFPVVLALSLTMIVSGISVYAKTRTSVENTAGTGVVRIRITPPGSHFENILPGQFLEITPVIRNEGNDCYIRASVELSGLSDHLTVQNVPEEWVRNKTDGYWYYRKIVKSGETVMVFDGLYAQPDLPQEFPEEKQIRLQLNAEAVQAANFTPDFEGDDPWGGVEAEACTGSGDAVGHSVGSGSEGLSVRYEGDSKKLITEPEDFFVNLPVLMPGDSFEQTIRLKNDASKSTQLYFCTEAKEGRDLLEKITLKIRSGGKLLYYGTLASSELEGEENAVLLADLEGKGTGECTFTVSVPKSLKNEFALKNCSVVWTFLTDDRQPPAETTEKETPKSPAGTPSRTVIHTGDENGIGLYLIMFGSAMLVMALAVRRWKNIKAG